MTVINKIPRGLRVFFVMAILGILIWRFAANTSYLYYSIGAAILITIGITYFIYHSPRNFSNNVNKAPIAPTRVVKDRPEMSEATAYKFAPEVIEDSLAINIPPIPLIEDQTTLTEDEQNQLVNAVWYRCENPYCKNTRFLSVHHIVDEKDSGTNKLDNLVVLCPYCHDLAHNNEIPEKVLRDWAGTRVNRFKSKLEWPYF